MCVCVCTHVCTERKITGKEGWKYLEIALLICSNCFVAGWLFRVPFIKMKVELSLKNNSSNHQLQIFFKKLFPSLLLEIFLNHHNLYHKLYNFPCCYFSYFELSACPSSWPSILAKLSKQPLHTILKWPDKFSLGIII